MPKLALSYNPIEKKPHGQIPIAFLHFINYKTRSLIAILIFIFVIVLFFGLLKPHDKLCRALMKRLFGLVRLARPRGRVVPCDDWLFFDDVLVVHGLEDLAKGHGANTANASAVFLERKMKFSGVKRR